MVTTAHPILSETPLTFAEAAASLPVVGGRRVTAKVIYKWADQGVVVRGERVKLESCKLGGRRVTSAEAVARFVAATSSPDEPTATPPRTPTVRRRASEAAAKYVLDEIAAIK